MDIVFNNLTAETGVPWAAQYKAKFGTSPNEH